MEQFVEEWPYILLEGAELSLRMAKMLEIAYIVICSKFGQQNRVHQKHFQLFQIKMWTFLFLWSTESTNLSFCIHRLKE